MAQIIRTILEIDEEETQITLLYACRSYEEILIKKQLDAWADHWNFTVTYYLSREGPATAQNKKLYNDKIIYHRICHDDVAETLGTVDISKSCAFVCGPPCFENEMENLFLHNCFPKENVIHF